MTYLKKKLHSFELSMSVPKYPLYLKIHKDYRSRHEFYIIIMNKTVTNVFITIQLNLKKE